MMFGPVVDNWFIVEVRWQGIVQPHRHLSGIVWRYSPVPDGAQLITKPLQWISRESAQARTSYRLYHLGRECTLQNFGSVDFEPIASYLADLWDPPFPIMCSIELPDPPDADNPVHEKRNSHTLTLQ